VPEYNILRTAGSPYGRKHTEETKTKISAAKIGYQHSEESMAKMRGRVVSEEARAKISAELLNAAKIIQGLVNQEQRELVYLA
jgi:hypothetical protein